jgi:predicted small lipoprotein YifL
MMEAEPMRVLQYAKRSVLTAAAVCVALTGCGDSGPDVPFNPAGTTADIEAVNSTFGSSTFESFSTFSLMFDAALGGAPLISASAAAMDVRGKDNAGMRAAAVQTARRLAAVLPRTVKAGASASIASIPVGMAGKTFEYSAGAYAMTERAGAPSNGVRFILYAVDPVTFAPVEPLVETGYVDLIDLSSGSTSAAQVVVVSGDTEYLRYTVAVTNTSSGGRVSVLGFVTDGVHQANVNLRATVTFNAGLTLTYAVDVPTRDFSIDLTLVSSGLDPESGTIALTLDVRGSNGWIRMTGQFDDTGATINVSVSGEHFATITAVGAGDPVITGADGQPLTDEDIAALSSIFFITADAFASFDQLFIPVGGFLEPAA